MGHEGMEKGAEAVRRKRTQHKSSHTSNAAAPQYQHCARISSDPRVGIVDEARHEEKVHCTNREALSLRI